MRRPIALEYFRKSSLDRFDKRSGRDWRRNSMPDWSSKLMSNDDAKGVIEICTTEQRSSRIEQYHVEAMLTPEPLHALAHRRIIVREKD